MGVGTEILIGVAFLAICASCAFAWFVVALLRLHDLLFDRPDDGFNDLTDWERVSATQDDYLLHAQETEPCI